jgi:hypothetical protein
LSEAAGGADTSGRGRLPGAVVVGLLVVALAVASLMGRLRKPPKVPEGLVHRAAHGGRQAAVCLGCHARGSALDRPESHTGRQDCWSCHDLP